MLINGVHFQSLGSYSGRKPGDWLSPFRGTILKTKKKKKERPHPFKSLSPHAPLLMFRWLWERSHAPADRCNIWGCLSARPKRLGTAGLRCAETLLIKPDRLWNPEAHPAPHLPQPGSSPQQRQSASYYLVISCGGPAVWTIMYPLTPLTSHGPSAPSQGYITAQRGLWKWKGGEAVTVWKFSRQAGIFPGYNGGRLPPSVPVYFD